MNPKQLRKKEVKPVTDPKYDGPFETQEEEDAALARYERVRTRAKEKAELAEAEKNKTKKSKLLPIVE